MLSDAEERPLPKDDTTPPVTNINRAMELFYSDYLIKWKELIINFQELMEYHLDFSSMISNTEDVGVSSPLDIIVKAKLQIIKRRCNYCGCFTHKISSRSRKHKIILRNTNTKGSTFRFLN